MSENGCCKEFEERIEILEEKIAALESRIRWTQRKLLEEE